MFQLKISLLNFSTNEISQLHKIRDDKKLLIFNFVVLNNIQFLEMSNSNKNIIFLKVDKDEKNTRILIWQIQKKLPNTLIVLCDIDPNSSILAWRANLFYFLLMPFLEIDLDRLFEKLSMNNEMIIPKFKFNHKNGSTLINPEDICFCKSNGNYTEIFMKNNRKVLITKKLKELEDLFTNSLFLYRIGKCYIINLKRIQKINFQLVSFDGIDLPVKFSDIYIQRIKGALLWYI